MDVSRVVVTAEGKWEEDEKPIELEHQLIHDAVEESLQNSMRRCYYNVSYTTELKNRMMESHRAIMERYAMYHPPQPETQRDHDEAEPQHSLPDQSIPPPPSADID